MGQRLIKTFHFPSATGHLHSPHPTVRPHFLPLTCVPTLQRATETRGLPIGAPYFQLIRHEVTLVRIRRGIYQVSGLQEEASSVLAMEGLLSPQLHRRGHRGSGGEALARARNFRGQASSCPPLPAAPTQQRLVPAYPQYAVRLHRFLRLRVKTSKSLLLKIKSNRTSLPNTPPPQTGANLHFRVEHLKGLSAFPRLVCPQTFHPVCPGCVGRTGSQTEGSWQSPGSLSLRGR